MFLAQAAMKKWLMMSFCLFTHSSYSQSLYMCKKYHIIAQVMDFLVEYVLNRSSDLASNFENLIQFWKFQMGAVSKLFKSLGRNISKNSTIKRHAMIVYREGLCLQMFWHFQLYTQLFQLLPPCTQNRQFWC